MHNFYHLLVPLNERPTDDMTHLSRPTSISVAIYAELCKEPQYLFDENPQRLIKRFFKVLAEKQEAIVAVVLQQYPYPLDLQMLPGEAKKQWKH